MYRPTLTLLVPLAAISCAGSQSRVEAPVEEPPAEAGPEVPAGEALTALEERLLGASSLRIRASITSEGAVASSLEGTLLLADPDRASLDFEGTFEGEAASPHLISDGSILRGGQQHEPFAEAVPDHLHEGLLIGLTRMGLLHNLATLCGGEAPDHTDGTVREWVTWVDAAYGEPEEVGGVRARPITFVVTVDGEPRAEAALWFDETTGLPVERWQTVRFDEGEMRVVERYESFELDVEVEPAEFDVMSGLPGGPGGE